jgi:choline dehydrogenase-like flavoprotein
MATTLKKTNVVIIGLGAAGGIACLPIAQSGLEVIGLEAGSWLDTKDMAPDELKLNRGLWPPGPQKTKLEGITARANASSDSYSLKSSDDECGWRDIRSLLGTELAVEPLGF